MGATWWQVLRTASISRSIGALGGRQCVGQAGEDRECLLVNSSIGSLYWFIGVLVTQDLKDYMRQAGEVTYADAHKQRRNEGVVEFASLSDMKNAIEKLDDTELNGRRIHLSEDKSARRSSRRSRSRSKSSRSRSRSKSRRSSRSKSRSESKSKSRSRSRSRSKSHSRSKSASPARHEKSKSKSRSISKERSKHSHSKSRSRSIEKARSEERSPRSEPDRTDDASMDDKD